MNPDEQHPSPAQSAEATPPLEVTPPAEATPHTDVTQSAGDTARTDATPQTDAVPQSETSVVAVDSEAAAPAPDNASAPPAPEAQPAAPPKPIDPKMEERRKAAAAAWERVVGAKTSGETLTGTVTAVVKGGLLVDIASIRGFLPASQVAVALGTAPDTLVKTRIPLKILDIDAGRRRAVVSHRRAVDEERRTKRTELLKSLAVGQRREATVVRIADFGAFVDLGGVDGLIPMSELALERIDKASDAVSIGEKLTVEVIRIDEGGKKIALSRKNALPDPWRDHADVLRQGNVVTGKVVAKEPRLTVEIAPGVTGSVRESDADPADYEIGEAMEVSVRSIDRRTRRITLTTMHGEAAAVRTTVSGFAPLGIELQSKTKK